MTSLAFVVDPKADIILKSSDGTSFPVRRLYLQAASEVFEEMLSSGSDDKAEKDKGTGLPVVTLQDSAKELDVFLRYIDRDQDRRSKGGKPLSLDETMA
jgi:hypothetical protein